jgi:membrane-bound lytic murein transglycosylase A
VPRARGARIAALALVALLTSCVRVIPGETVSTPTTPPTTTAPATALSAGLNPGPAVEKLGMASGNARLALLSFIESCPRLLARNDASGLTRQTDWRLPCEAAGRWKGEPVNFFATYFETVRVGPGDAFATGYFEQEIEGVRQRQPGYDVPVYAMPPDLVRSKPGEMPPLESGQMPLGRYDQAGQFVPYHDRTAIEQGALMGKGLEIGWARDPVEFFFLQIQGSGRLRGPDGTVVRIGYAGQNGHPYTGIGGLMRQRGLIGSGPGQYSGSMQGIMRYIRENPEAGEALMRENKSWVFFRELTGDGPIGALGVPVRPKSSVAADPRFVPLGAPVWLDLDRAEADGMWIAQDTGGAIKGANRFDTFWGHGDQARSTAGGMSGKGQALLLLPKGTLRRLAVQ